jgi:hypothetical protein
VLRIGFCVLAVMANVAFAAAIAGTVRDAQGGEVLGRVRVQIVGASLKTVTDAAGRFRFDTVPPGRYTLNVETVGYRLLKRDVEVADTDLCSDITDRST